ncbi:MAG: MBL fold metallo-hydrolase, partial [Candidatus Cryptobacteroides sp.]
MTGNLFENENLRPVFLSLSSGSSGNCYFLGRFMGRECVDGILIDAGVSLRRLKTLLAEEDISTDCIHAVLVTHDHMDHIRSLASYCKKLRKPVWTSRSIAAALSGRTYSLEGTGVTPGVLEEGVWNDVAGFGVRYFIVPHDATQTVGYYIKVPLEGRDHRFFIMTDAGRVTDEAVQFAARAETVVFESNYDMDMLLGGTYPAELKRRIMDGSGHLSNDECASAIKRFCHNGLRNIFLCHLSENNNTPRCAWETS